jgi:hypothetical protein
MEDKNGPNVPPTAADIQDGAEPDELSSEQITSRALLYAFDQGVEMLEQSGEFEPFTIIISGEELFIEEQPGENPDESYASARRTVYQMERLSDAYLFCYDGYVELDAGPSDALIVEWANKGDENAQIIIKLYHRHGEHYHFDEALYQVGETGSFYHAETDGAAAAEGGSETDGAAAADGCPAADGAAVRPAAASDTQPGDAPAAAGDTQPGLR